MTDSLQKTEKKQKTEKNGVQTERGTLARAQTEMGLRHLMKHPLFRPWANWDSCGL